MDEQGNGRGLLRTLLGRGPRALKISNYRAGDLNSPKPVKVTRDAAVAGNIIAPRVEVAGLLYGHVVTRELLVAPGAEIWGDVFAVVVRVEAGGQIHGWLHTTDEAGYESMAGRNGGGPPVEPFAAEEMPPGRLPEALRGAEPLDERRPEHLALLQLIQQETGAALLARRELERAFEERVQEVAGDTLAQVRALEESLQQVQAEAAGLEGLLAEREALLQLQAGTLAEQAAELEGLQDLLGSRSAALEQTESDLMQSNQLLLSLEEENETLRGQLHESLDTGHKLSGRIESLESALQDAVQHSAEQREALLRWQELAEVTQEEVAELEARLQVREQDLQESVQKAELMRELREQAEAAWEQATDELQLLRQELDQRPAGGTEEGSAEVEQRMEQMEEALAAAQVELQEQQEYLLWHKMSLQTTTAALRAAREELQDAESAEAAARVKAEKASELAENWKGNVSRLSELLYEAQQQVKEREKALAEVIEVRSALAREREALQQRLRERDTQIGAMEREIEDYHRELEAQGKRLAEIRGLLAEEQIKLRDTSVLLKKRTADGRRVYQAATRRIEELAVELEETRRQLNDCLGWADRRRRRDDV